MHRSTLQVVKVPLDAILSLQWVDSTTQLGAVGNIAGGGVGSVVHVADKLPNSSDPKPSPEEYHYDKYRKFVNSIYQCISDVLDKMPDDFTLPKNL